MKIDKKEKLIPELRFKEFKEEWVEQPLGEMVSNKSETYSANKSNLPCIELESLSQGTGILLKTFDSKNLKSTKNIFHKGDVLFGKLRPYLKKYYLADFDGVCTTEIWVLKGRILENKYLYYLIQTPKFYAVSTMSSGSKMPRSDWEYISNIPFNYPSLPEQQKISSFLSLIDKKIELLNKKKELLEIYKKGIMHNIFNRDIRFKDSNGNDYPEWEEKRLGEILIEYDEKNKENNSYPILSSTKGGLFLQQEYFNREIASKNNIGYKILKKNQLVFSPQNLWLGNINLNYKYNIGVVSPSYRIFEIKKEFALFDYMKYIIKLPRMIYEYEMASEQGASVVRRNLNEELFNSIPIKLPSIIEQNVISTYLKKVDLFIDSNCSYLKKLSIFKKSLLQKLFI